MPTTTHPPTPATNNPAAAAQADQVSLRRSATAVQVGVDVYPACGRLLVQSAVAGSTSGMRNRGADAWSVHNDNLDGLARRAATGDATAFAQLLEIIEVEGLIRRPVRRILVDGQMVEDVCQDVLVTLTDKIGTWDGRSTFSSWLYIVARNKAADRLKAVRPTEPLPEVIAAEGQRISSLITTREAIRQAVDALPETYRVPVVMRDFEELDYPTIGRLLGLTETAVRARVKRGRRKVAARLQGLRR